MKRREALLALIASAVIVLALLTVFAIELANTQAQSKQDVKARVHERGVLAAALIGGVFQAGEQQALQYARTYGGRTVPSGDLIVPPFRTYVALLDSTGRPIASRGLPSQARAQLTHSGAVALVRSGEGYRLGDLQPYGSTGVINYAVAFPTRYGRRILVTGFTPALLDYFVSSDLRKIPGVAGAQNYLVDGDNAVVGSTNPGIAAGHVLDLSALQEGRYVDLVPLANSSWRVVLAAPTGPLFASVSGKRKWIPWAIFAAFALVALVALALGRRVLRSTSQIHQANVALEERNAEFARSNTDLEHFASIASHDLQEPLRKVRTFTQRVTITESANLSPKGHDYLQRANAAAARMQVLIEDLLRFSRVTTHQRPFAKVDLDQLTREVLRDLSDQVSRSGASVHIGDLPTITADPVQLRQLMQNLISNALKFRRPEVDHEVRIEAGGRGDMLEITVRDNGIGFDGEYAERIFGVFERLHGRSEYPGTGIGLALCRKIAQRHGGTIVAQGVAGEGATFTVALPLWGTDPASNGQPQKDRTHVAV
jgi:signal transduction histidine kinase